MRLHRKRVILAVIALLAIALFVRLGVWQLDRRAERRAANEAREARLAMPPVRLGPEALPPPADSLAWRRVVLEGSYDFGREVVLRGRTYGGVPGAELLTPLRLGDLAVLVHRGWLQAADAYRPDLASGRPPGSSAAAPGRAAQVAGVALPAPADVRLGGAIRVDFDGREHLVLSSLDLSAASRELPYAVAEFYVRATDPGPAGPGLQRLAELDLSDGPHLGYAIQWFAFALIAAVGTGALLLRREPEHAPALQVVEGRG